MYTEGMCTIFLLFSRNRTYIFINWAVFFLRTKTIRPLLLISKLETLLMCKVVLYSVSSNFRLELIKPHGREVGIFGLLSKENIGGESR